MNIQKNICMDTCIALRIRIALTYVNVCWLVCVRVRGVCVCVRIHFVGSFTPPVGEVGSCGMYGVGAVFFIVKVFLSITSYRYLAAISFDGK